MSKQLTASRIWIIALCAVIVLSLACAAAAFFRPLRGAETPGLTIVRAPEQSESGRPEGFPDPEANWVKLPAGKNLAEGKRVTAGEVTEVYTASNATDGDTNTYWESKGFPAEITVALDGVYTVQTAAVRLNPAALWEARAQTVAVLVSIDGAAFTTAFDAAKLDFDPASGNIARVDFSPVQAGFVRFVFSGNSSARSAGAQAAELLVFE